MRAVIQRVKEAKVFVNGEKIGEIGVGLLVYLGIGKESRDEDIDILVKKITEMRIFPDGEKESALSVSDIGGGLLLISQFTLYGDIRKGRRPSFSNAMEIEKARIFYEKCLNKFKNSGVHTESGMFQAIMEVESVNYGPYTIILEL